MLRCGEITTVLRPNGETEIGLKQGDKKDQTTTETYKGDHFSANMQQYEEKDKTILPPHIGVK